MATLTVRPRRRPGTASSNGNHPPKTITLAPPGRRMRTPEIMVGVLVIVVFALAAVLWHLNAVDRSPALAIATSVERGETIAADDVEVVYLASDAPVERLDGSQMDEVVGRVALVDLAAGTLLSRSVVADRPALVEGEGVVGLSLEPGGYPAMGLSPGDHVNIVRATDTTSPPEDGDATGEVVIATDATVFAVEELPSNRRLISILAEEADADAVAAAAGTGTLRLVQVSP